MRILVGHASRHGSTVGIAERIADELRSAGFDVDCRPVREVDDVDRYDAFVIGAAAYLFHWLKDATRFVKRHQGVLRERPVWLFSSGPLGTDLVDDEGRDILDVTRPKEFDQFVEMISPVDTRVFFGAWDPDVPPTGLAERFMLLLPSARTSMPTGDFRDWAEVQTWAASIASSLSHRDAPS